MLAISNFKNASYKEHFHPYHSIALITEGEVCFEIDKKIYIAKEGDIRIFNPFEVHSIKRSSWSHINLSLNFKGVDGFVFENIIQDEQLKNCLYRIYDKKRLSDGFVSKLKRFQKKNEIKPSKKFEKVLKYIQLHLDEDLDIQRLSSIYNISKYHFAREFKKDIGISVHRYIQMLRVAKVREELELGNSLSIASFSAGFCDQSHMIRTYKNFYGHTPSKISKIIL